MIDAPHAAVIREDGIPELCEAKVIATDAWNDVALLSVETERAFDSTTIKPLVSSVGDSLRVVGRVPWSVQDQYAHSGVTCAFTLQSATAVQATFMESFPESDEVPATVAYASSPPVNTGWSGGAVIFTGSREVIAMHSGGMHEGVYRGIPATVLHEFLRANRVKTKTAGFGKQRETEDSFLRRWLASADQHISRFISRVDPEALSDLDYLTEVTEFLEPYVSYLPAHPLVGLAQCYLHFHRGEVDSVVDKIGAGLRSGCEMQACTVIRDLKLPELQQEAVLRHLRQAHQTYADKTSTVGGTIRDELEYAISWLLKEAGRHAELADFMIAASAHPPASEETPGKRLWLARSLALASRTREATDIFGEVAASNPDSLTDLDYTLWVRAVADSTPEGDESAVRLALSQMSVRDAERETFLVAAEAATRLGLQTTANQLLERAKLATPSPTLAKLQDQA